MKSRKTEQKQRNGKVLVSIWVDVELVNAMKKLAESESRSLSNLGEKILRETVIRFKAA